MRRTLPGLLLAGLTVWATAASGSGEAADPVAALHAVTWEAGFLGSRLGGSACWLADAAGSLRLEIRQDEDDPGRQPSALESLLDWRGRGWTLVLGADGQGTANAWLEPWRPVEPAVGRWVLAVAAAAAGAPVPTAGPDVVPSLPAHRFAAPAAAAGGRRRLQLPRDPATDHSFRRTLTERGDGRGARIETLTLAWSDPAGWSGGGGSLEIRSSRRPGRIRLSGLTSRPVRYLDPETFVPLWPLREVLDFGGGISGTRGPHQGSTTSR